MKLSGRHDVIWYDEGGNEYRQSWRVEMAELGTYPKHGRLVDVQDDDGHLLGVLTYQGSGVPPLLMTAGRFGPVPVAQLVDGMFQPVLVDLESGTVGALGAAMNEQSLRCPRCAQPFIVSATALATKASERQSKRVPCLVVRAMR